MRYAHSEKLLSHYGYTHLNQTANLIVTFSLIKLQLSYIDYDAILIVISAIC